MDALAELWSWLVSLDAPFAFLLALPFVVGALGVVALGIQQRRPATAPRRSAPLRHRGRSAAVE